VRGSQVEIVPPAGDLPSIAAAAYVVVDGDTGEPLASFNADQPRPVASLTKLMTARLVLDAGQLESHRVKFGRAVVGVVRMSAPAVHAVRDGDALAH
jgi:D-alanyl-D-alanine carboxypeptidase